MLVDKQQEDR